MGYAGSRARRLLGVPGCLAVGVFNSPGLSIVKCSRSKGVSPHKPKFSTVGVARANSSCGHCPVQCQRSSLCGAAKWWTRTVRPMPIAPTCHTILHAGHRSAGSRELGGCPSLRAARPCRRAVGPSPLTRRTLSTAPAAARTITLAHAASQPQRVGACCVIGTRINEL